VPTVKTRELLNSYSHLIVHLFRFGQKEELPDVQNAASVTQSSTPAKCRELRSIMRGLYTKEGLTRDVKTIHRGHRNIHKSCGTREALRTFWIGRSHRAAPRCSFRVLVRFSCPCPGSGPNHTRRPMENRERPERKNNIDHCDLGGERKTIWTHRKVARCARPRPPAAPCAPAI